MKALMNKFMFLLISLLTFTSSTSIADDAQAFFNTYNLQSNIFQNLILVSSNKRTDNKNSRTYKQWHYKKNNYKILVESIESVDSRYGASLTRLFRTELIGTYQNRRSPYTGESATSIACSKDNVPQIYPVSYYNIEADVLVLNSTERDTLGVCQASLIKQKVMVFLGYNPEKKTFISVRVYMPVSIYNKNILNEFLGQFKGKIPY